MTTPVTPGLNSRDEIVVIFVMTITLITPIVLVVWWTIEDRLFPPMLISILFGIAIATLTYRYLGGTEKSEFKVGALKLAGSAAMLLGTASLTNYFLSEQMTDQLRPNRISVLEKEIEALRKKNMESETGRSGDRNANTEQVAKLEAEIYRLKLELDKRRGEAESNLVESLKGFAPESNEGRRIIELFRRREGPFSSLKRSFDVKATVVHRPRDIGSIYACDDLKLRDEDVRLTSLTGESGESQTIAVRHHGDISSSVCMPPDGKRKFAIQISCEAGKELFPEHIAGCGNDGRALWKSDAQRVFDVRVDIPNDFCGP